MAAIDKTLEIGSSALKAGTKQLSTSSNNIANLQSVAHKGQDTLLTDSFSETLQQSAASPGGSTGGSNTSAIQVGSGTKVGTIYRNFSQGSLQTTNISSFLAVEGKGWFQVLNSMNGEVFATRDGSFKIDDNDFFVTKQGFRVQGMLTAAADEPTYTVRFANGGLVFDLDTPPATPSATSIGSMNVEFKLTVAGGTITKDASVPGTYTDAQIEAAAPRLRDYSVNEKGELQIQLSDGNEFVRGQFLLMYFKDEQALMAESGGLYSGFAAAGVDTFAIGNSEPGTGGRGQIRQRMLEGSNVDLTEEFAKIIGAQKYIQAASRIITTADRVLEEVVNLKR